MAQTVGKPYAMQETWVRYLSQEDPLEKGMATPVQQRNNQGGLHFQQDSNTAVLSDSCDQISETEVFRILS